MSRQSPLPSIAVAAALALLAGCHPQQPFYFHEDGDLSHYLGVATEIDYPDVDVESLAEVEGTMRPFSLENSQPREIWELSLEEAIHCALANSKVMRSLGGVFQQLRGPGVNAPMPDFLIRNPASTETGEGGAVRTVYDPAIRESDPRFGAEAALSAFDAQFTSSLFWEKNDTPRNVALFAGAFFPRTFQQDLGTFQTQLLKTAATGGSWALRHNVVYDQSVGPRLFPSDWNVNLEAELRQPLLQGAGVQFNRIAGPGASPGSNNGVMIARIRTDVELADFEGAVRNMVYDVEYAYWELYFAYRGLDAMIAARNRSLETWRHVHAEYLLTAAAQDEALARHQYFEFRGILQNSLSVLYAAESNLRYMMGLAATDGRLIRPSDEPVTAKLTFDWCEILSEGLARSVELREERWNVKRRELDLIAAKNYLLPRLDAVGRYRWLGLGDDLIDSRGGSGDPAVIGSNAYQSMTSGNFQEWQFGLELSIPIGFRRQMAGVRHAQLNLARERARLQEQELELSHQLAFAIRQLEAHHVLSQTYFNLRIAAQRELEAIEAKEEAGYAVREAALDRLLDAQRRLAQAESDYYRSLVYYNQAIAHVHYRKGSLLEYNGVYLAEGPWPGKAYFDARRRARARDAALYLDYGYTHPRVISRGAYRQHAADGLVLPDDQTEAGAEDQPMPEPIPTPAPEPTKQLVEPPEPKPDDGPVEPSSSEPTASQPAADRPGFGPILAAPQAAKQRLAAKQTKASDTPETAVLKTLKLDKPTGEVTSQKSSTIGRWSPVKPTGGNQPVRRRWAGMASAHTPHRAGIDKPKTAGRLSAETRAAPLKRSNFKGLDTTHEAVANPPAAETDRPSSGWKGVQR